VAWKKSPRCGQDQDGELPGAPGLVVQLTTRMDHLPCLTLLVERCDAVDLHAARRGAGKPRFGAGALWSGRAQK
jgi:hypothetical protein